MSICTEKTEQRGSSGPSDNEDTLFYILPSTVLKFASGREICQRQPGLEDESLDSKDQQSHNTLRHENNWSSRKVQMSAIIKEIKIARMQSDTYFSAKSWDMANQSSSTKAQPWPPGIDVGKTATPAGSKKHANNRRAKESSQQDRTSPPCLSKGSRPMLNRTQSSPVEEDLDCQTMPRLKRRQSDPLVSLTSRPQVNRKSKASLMRRVSPLQLLSKVTTYSNSKGAGSLSPRLMKRGVHPAISKLHEQLGARQAEGGSDPAVNTSHERPENEYGSFEYHGDFRRQVHYLAEGIERLNIHQFEGARTLNDGKACSVHTPCDGESLHEHFKESDIKLQGLMEDILRAHLLSLTDYKPASCDRTSRNICKLISGFLGSMKTSTHPQSKFACLVYIGAVRDQGIHAASRVLWSPEKDSYAVASFRNEFVYGLAAVFVTPID